MIYLLIGLGLFTVLLIGGCSLSRQGYESAHYKVIETDGSFEVRDYPTMTIASTGMKNSNESGDGSFMRLFDYISKGNGEQEKIAMTTPVFMTPENGGEMSFVVPQKVAADGAPAPSSASVAVKTMTFGKVAVYRYSGGWGAERKAAAQEKLAAWIEKRGLKTEGEYFHAGYDPPFTPTPLRRNETLIRLSRMGRPKLSESWAY